MWGFEWHFGFSYVGLLYQLLLYIPNIIWIKFKPLHYEKYVLKENKVLLVMERIGQVGVSSLSLIFSDFNLQLPITPYSTILFISFGLFVLYEAFWIRYFSRNPRTMKDFYSSFLGVPLAGATLPVASFFLLGVYGRNAPLILASVFLGIGHIGIHYDHKKEADRDSDKTEEEDKEKERAVKEEEEGHLKDRKSETEKEEEEKEKREKEEEKNHQIDIKVEYDGNKKEDLEEKKGKPLN